MDKLGDNIVSVRFHYKTFVSREAEGNMLLNIPKKKVIKVSDEIWDPIMNKIGFLFPLHGDIEMSDFSFIK